MGIGGHVRLPYMEVAEDKPLIQSLTWKARPPSRSARFARGSGPDMPRCSLSLDGNLSSSKQVETGQMLPEGSRLIQRYPGILDQLAELGRL